MQSNKTISRVDEDSLKQLGEISVAIKNGKDVPEIDIEPYQNMVIVQIAKIYSDSVIELPGTTLEDELMHQPKGVIRAVGPSAFYDEKKNNEKHPEIGDIIYFAKYSGRLHTDANNGNQYRIVLDSDIHFGDK